MKFSDSVYIVCDLMIHNLQFCACAENVLRGQVFENIQHGAHQLGVYLAHTHAPLQVLNAVHCVLNMSEPAENTQDTTIGTEGAPEENTEQQPTSQTANSTEEDEVKLKENGTGAPREEEPKPVVAPPPAKPKYRHDWYQTPTDVYINIMIKNLKPEDVSVDFEEKQASLIIV